MTSTPHSLLGRSKRCGRSDQESDTKEMYFVSSSWPLPRPTRRHKLPRISWGNKQKCNMTEKGKKKTFSVAWSFLFAFHPTISPFVSWETHPWNRDFFSKNCDFKRVPRWFSSHWPKGEPERNIENKLTARLHLLRPPPIWEATAALASRTWRSLHLCYAKLIVYLQFRTV